MRIREMLPAVMAGLFLPVLLGLAGCLSEGIEPPYGKQSVVMVMEVTGYCNCGHCCSWERGWMGLGVPVYSSGPKKGQPKTVGVTASGTRSKYGTIAADTTVVPFGTIIYVPGYGYGRVEDRGGKITGYKLDLWFETHEEAKRWGRKKMKVRVWR